MIYFRKNTRPLKSIHSEVIFWCAPLLLGCLAGGAPLAVGATSEMQISDAASE